MPVNSIPTIRECYLQAFYSVEKLKIPIFEYCTEMKNAVILHPQNRTSFHKQNITNNRTSPTNRTSSTKQNVTQLLIMNLRFLIMTILVATCISSRASDIVGTIIDDENGSPVMGAYVTITELSLWTVTDDKGGFVLNNIPSGSYSLRVQCMGYETYDATCMAKQNENILRLTIRLRHATLKLKDVVVVAERKKSASSTSYTIDRMALDNQQVLSLAGVMSLLPGGKTTNNNLTDDSRIALRSSSQEKGNASFGTGIEIDGVRLDNNAAMNETSSASTRMIGTSDIESVDVISGIPSVEYGDLSNGIVKVNLRKGASPFIFEAKVNQTTEQYAVSKGWTLPFSTRKNSLSTGERDGRGRSVLNVSFEHARSFSNIVSPHTAYSRNILSLRYNHTFMQKTTPLSLSLGASGNIGGYNSESDPDNMLESFSKSRDNMVRGNMELHWLLNKSWITNLTMKSSITYQDHLVENYSNTSSASSQPYIHVTEQGYHIAESPLPTSPKGEGTANDIILGPTGYWYVRSFSDQKPITITANIKGNWVRRMGRAISNLTLGADYKTTGNKGKGTYYEDYSVAPTWRPYRYDLLPWLTNHALYAEEMMTLMLNKHNTLQLTAGIRHDISRIRKSEYGRVSASAPRLTGRYTWRNDNDNDNENAVKSITLHAGWGRSYKLPSFQVLFPAPSYEDVLSFTPGSTYDNKAYYAYYTSPTTPIHNSSLRWQSTDQTDIGIEINLLGTRVSLSAFHHKTRKPYTSVVRYSPYTYNVTSQSAVEKCGIPNIDRRYSIDRETGIVTVSDAQGIHAPVVLPYTTQRAYQSQRMYTNGSDVERYGLEWIIDFTKIEMLNTSIRLDGNFYRYRGLDETLFAGGTSGQGTSSQTAYPLIGYYRGSSSTSVATAASGSISNGSINKELNMNVTITTRIPKVRLIMMLRMECTLQKYSRPLSELSDGTRGIILDSASDYFGTAYDGSTKDRFVAVYPEYYSTWDNPDEMIPFSEKFIWARDNDRTLYNQLARLVVKTNYAYTMNENSISPYYSVNFNITKEIGDHITLSFYANNFINNMAKVTASRTGLESTLYNSGYIPKFYYGLSLKLKI